MPLKRIKYLSIKNTKLIISGVFITSIFLTSYTAIISGLRKLSSYEITAEGGVGHECDVKSEYKHIYSYIVFIYIVCSIILPIILISFFNITIVHMILQRKKMAFKQYFMFAPSQA